MNAELIVRPLAEVSADQAERVIRQDELRQRIRSNWRKMFGAGATAELAATGKDLTELALYYKTVADRGRACEDLIRDEEGFFSAASDRRLRWAICLHHLAQRVPLLLDLPAQFARAVIEAARVKVDWKHMTDNAPAAYPDRLNALLPLLMDGTIGSSDRKADDTLWRAAVKTVVVEGKELAAYQAELSAQPTAAGQNSPTVQPQPQPAPAPAAPNNQQPAPAQPTAPEFNPLNVKAEPMTAGEGAMTAEPAADSGLSVQVQWCLSAIRHPAFALALKELPDSELAALLDVLADEDGRRAAEKAAAGQ